MRKFFGGTKPSSKLTLQAKCHHSCVWCDDSWSCEQLKKHVADKYFEKKLEFEPKSLSVILCSDTASQIMSFSGEYFLCDYGGQLKTVVEQETGEKIDCKR